MLKNSRQRPAKISNLNVAQSFPWILPFPDIRFKVEMIPVQTFEEGGATRVQLSHCHTSVRQWLQTVQQADFNSHL